MIRKLKRIAPLKFGIVSGVVYAIISLLFIPFFILGFVVSMLAPTQPNTSAQQGLGMVFGLAFCVLAPFIYGAAGFLFGMLAAWVYNVVAKWTGGIEFEVE